MACLLRRTIATGGASLWLLHQRVTCNLLKQTVTSVHMISYAVVLAKRATICEFAAPESRSAGTFV
eukprot:COSAG02_NODE_122_length_35306_cov_98.280967_39_plen_66_part_00